MKPRFFKTPRDLRTWLERHHTKVRELLIGFYTKASNKPSVTYHEALDEALSVGWIDGVRRNLSAGSYTIRFTPRKPSSYWSQVNTARAKDLIEQGRMTKHGLEVFEARDESRTRKYSYEREMSAFDPALKRQFKANEKAWTFFEAQPPGYRKVATFWVMSAKQADTRARRLATLISDCGRGRRLGLLRPVKEIKN